MDRLTDSEIRGGLEAGAYIAVARVAETAVEAPGTRGALTRYRLLIERNLAGRLPAAVEALRYGAAVLHPPQRAIVVLRDSQAWGFALESLARLDAAEAERSIREHLARIRKASASDPGTRPAENPLPEINRLLTCSGRFYYAISEEVGQEVLFFSLSLKNVGEKELVFSFYGTEPYVTALEPRSKIKSRSTRVACGGPAPAVAADLVRLPAGSEYTFLKWYWADGDFPFHSRARAERVTVYAVADNTALRAALCIKLSAAHDELAAFLEPGEALAQGTLCFKPIEFRYRRIHPQ